MFAALTAAAVIVAEAFVFPPGIALAAGVSISLLSSAALAAGLIYARASSRAFCVGAVASLLATRVVVVSNQATVFNLSTVFYDMITPWLATKNMNSYGVEYGLSWLFAIAGGFVAVVVRWLAQCR